MDVGGREVVVGEGVEQKEKEHQLREEEDGEVAVRGGLGETGVRTHLRSCSPSHTAETSCEGGGDVLPT
jgi:hypothetical protein